VAPYLMLMSGPEEKVTVLTPHGRSNAAVTVFAVDAVLTFEK